MKKFNISDIMYLETRTTNRRYKNDGPMYSTPKEFVFETDKMEFDLEDFYKFCQEHNIAYINDCAIDEIK